MAKECLGLRARKLDRMVTRIYDDALRPYEIKSTQFALLVAIQVSQPVSAAELGRALEVEKSTVSRGLARLVERGWVSVIDGDGRSQNLSCTKAGSQLIETAHQGWKLAQRQAKALVGKDAAAALQGIHIV